MIRSPRHTAALRPLARLVGAVGVVAMLVLGCSDEPIGPDEQPFGRIGDVRIEVLSPTQGGNGQVSHVVEWSSNGPWRSTERIFYRGLLGDETVLRSGGDRTSLARTYAVWIDLVNDTPSVALFGRVDPALRPVCPPPTSRVTLTIVDRTLADSIAWTRCSEASLPSLSGAGAGPDANASRVVQAAALARDFTLALQKNFRYQYPGSVPFATIERGGESARPLSVPRVIENEQNWRLFWEHLTGTQELPPAVNFGADVVLVGTVGAREEAGDSVEIRGVFPVTTGTQVSLWERRPGHFCTPARDTHVPYHIVIAPANDLPRPIFFSDASLDTVPCG
jgi:hypothetical protein